MRVRVTVAGEKEFLRAVDLLGDEAIVATKQVFAKAGDEAVARIRPHVPVDPKDGGQLKASIRRKRPSYSKRTGRVTCTVAAGGDNLADDPARASVYPWAQEKGEAVLHGQVRRFSHSVGQSPYMAVEFFRIAATLNDKLMAEFDKRAKRLGWSIR